MPPVNTHQSLTYRCLERECSHKHRGRGAIDMKAAGYNHLITDHSNKYQDTLTFQNHYKIYFRNYFDIK